MQGLEGLVSWQEAIKTQRDPDATWIALCAGTGCLALGCQEVARAFREELSKHNLEGKVEVKETGCPGFCQQGPLIVVHPDRIFYPKLKPADARTIVEETVLRSQPVEELLYKDPATGKAYLREDEVPFYQKQMRLVSQLNGVIDPTHIGDYVMHGGYQAAAKALFDMEPQQVIDEIKRSGLRGRGGGGFPTGTKWQSCRDADGEPKYVICNADEGDPGAFMDRALLEGNPHAVIEGMIIGAYALGSHEGYVYVRNEYPLALRNLQIAIERAEGHNLLGENIMGSGFDFRIKINRGGGAFVCGESTALMASIEGRVGEPRAKYVHTVEHGLYGKPTNLNNVETWANVPHVIDKGADWFSSIGTETSKGTKVFSLVGHVNNTGLIEVPMGITLREVMFDIGGGVPKGRQFKAVQTGGPSGGTIIVDTTGAARPAEERDERERGPALYPESLIDLPVDFESLTEAGSMMGSGGMIVMDETTCMVDVARYFLNFLTEESCGKCTPCREGIRNMLGILDRICEGQGREGDIELLQEMSDTVADTSLCALGGTAPNPVLSTIRYFRPEYEAHIRDKRCPAGVCTALITYSIDPEKCTGCHACFKACPTEAISGETKAAHVVDTVKCVKCGSCLDVCKFDAVVKQ
jgi:NADH:ubiquinone oxidoreductase subunit F (NADH-binding)/(2Fe-2S) ferredoxin/Pyruvate/2-oxoacid:ferredoxin oxidoreductase delta subunit